MNEIHSKIWWLTLSPEQGRNKVTAMSSPASPTLLGLLGKSSFGVSLSMPQRCSWKKIKGSPMAETALGFSRWCHNEMGWPVLFLITLLSHQIPRELSGTHFMRFGRPHSRTGRKNNSCIFWGFNPEHCHGKTSALITGNNPLISCLLHQHRSLSLCWLLTTKSHRNKFTTNTRNDECKSNRFTQNKPLIPLDWTSVNVQLVHVLRNWYLWTVPGGLATHPPTASCESPKMWETTTEKAANICHWIVIIQFI